MQFYTVKADEEGNRFWYRDRQFHREDGPAIEWADGIKHWCRDGQFHREDGPAAEWPDGSKEWYLHGEELTEAEFNARQGQVIEIYGKRYRLVPL